MSKQIWVVSRDDAEIYERRIIESGCDYTHRYRKKYLFNFFVVRCPSESGRADSFSLVEVRS